MSAEPSEFPVLLNLSFCFLDYTYEELGAIYNYKPLIESIAFSGPEGINFLSGLEDFLESRPENGVFEPTDANNDWELRSIWSYKLPVETVDDINAFAQSFNLFKTKLREPL